MNRPRTGELLDGAPRRPRQARQLWKNHTRRQSSRRSRTDPGTRNPQRRRGAALIFVLIVLLFLSLLGGSLVRMTLAQHRQQLNEELRIQTIRLAEAGWNRAARKLAQDPNYAGETWRLNLEHVDQNRTAAVHIEILPTDNDPAVKRLRVTAEFPVDAPQVHRVSREGRIQIDQ